MSESRERRVCRECKIDKKITEFAKNQMSIKGAIIRRPVCKECYKKKKPIPSNTRREYEAKHPRPKMGENFTCPICQKSFTREFNGDVVLDHSHKTGEIRGWICNSCNTSIGKFNEDVNVLERAIKWLKGCLSVLF